MAFIWHLFCKIGFIVAVHRSLGNTTECGCSDWIWPAEGQAGPGRGHHQRRIILHDTIWCKYLRNAISVGIMLHIVLELIGGTFMATAVRISEELVDEAKRFGRIDHRSLAGQIEHWARLGKCAEENPDLPYSLIKEILIGLDELEQGKKSEYKFG
jgi:hypothetical protein